MPMFVSIKLWQMGGRNCFPGWDCARELGTVLTAIALPAVLLAACSVAPPAWSDQARQGDSNPPRALKDFPRSVPASSAPPLRRSAVSVAGAGAAGAVGARRVDGAGYTTTDTTTVPSAMPLEDDVPLDEYMRALRQIGPAAAEGASRFMRAYQGKCGRSLRTVELRAAVAQDGGDPVLMQMIRAAYDQDQLGIQRLEGLVDCHGPAKRAAARRDER